MGPIPSLAQTPPQQPAKQLPQKSVNYQICTLRVNTQTGEATSVCSPVYQCTSTKTSTETLGKLSIRRKLEETDKSELTTTHAARITL